MIIAKLYTSGDTYNKLSDFKMKIQHAVFSISRNTIKCFNNESNSDNNKLNLHSRSVNTIIVTLPFFRNNNLT